jgi:hypothetical protein
VGLTLQVRRSWSAVSSELQIEVVEQLSGLDVEPVGDPQDRRESWFAHSALEPADHRGVDVGGPGEGILGKATLSTYLAHAPTECRTGVAQIVSRPH